MMNDFAETIGKVRLRDPKEHEETQS